MSKFEVADIDISRAIERIRLDRPDVDVAVAFTPDQLSELATINSPKFFWRGLLFDLSVLGIGFGSFWLGDHYHTNGFLSEIASAVVIAIVIASLIDAYPRVVGFVASNLNKKGLAKSWVLVKEWIRDFLTPPFS